MTCLCNEKNPYFLKNFKTRKDLVPTLPPASFHASILFARSTPNAAQLSSASKTRSSRLWVFFARLPSPTASPLLPLEAEDTSYTLIVTVLVN